MMLKIPRNFKTQEFIMSLSQCMPSPAPLINAIKKSLKLVKSRQKNSSVNTGVKFDFNIFMKPPLAKISKTIKKVPRPRLGSILTSFITNSAGSQINLSSK